MAAYCRVSTDHEEQTNSFENQIEYYTDYITKRKDYELAGIYSDEGITATNTKKREGFNRMIADCESGKIDMVITKSISRFARNTQDCLKYARKLKGLGINIFFEKENISTMDATGELLFTILSSLAQEESRNVSENCKWAIRHNFKKGKASINTTLFLGFNKTEDGKLEIDEKQAKLVRYIYKLYEEGLTPSCIGSRLREEGYKGLKADTWPHSVILGMLQNEKYCGDLLMQKTYTTDFLSKKKVKNHGEVDQYFIEDNHPAIIPKDEWHAVQMEVERREKFKNEVGIRSYGYGRHAFSCKVVCSRCGRVYGRHKCSGKPIVYWICENKLGHGSCGSENVTEESLYKVFRIAWNSIVANLDENTARWKQMIEEGNPLERLRGKQMIELTAEGPLTDDVPELIMMTVERIVVHSKQEFEVRLLDGTVKRVCLSE